MYLNYKSFSVDIDCETLCFRAMYSNVRAGKETPFIENGRINVTDLNGNPLSVGDFKQKEVSEVFGLEATKIKIVLSGGTVATPSLELLFTCDSHGLSIFANARAYTTISGDFRWGSDMENSTFSIRTGNQNSVLHTASGPVVSPFDNALYDRLTDSMLTYRTAGKMQVRFDWQKKCYSFTHTNGLDHGKELRFTVKKEVIESKYNTPFAPLEYAHQFKTPPIGWMTWYAVKFDCSREKVFENAEKFTAIFSKYTETAPVIWVDWEWCHKCFDGQGEEGADIFHPRKTAYPGGLKEVADKIKSLGAVPALWTGATNEGVLNDMLREHPEWVAGKRTIWCGQYWVDLTNPEVLEKYIKKIFRQILDWGYEVVKWDCLPATLESLSLLHDNLYDKTQSPHQALRNAVAAARSVLGKEHYLLSCCGTSERDTTFAVDLFDAARIGNDIFTWEDYLEQSVNLVLHYYPLHNTVYYADGDNLVLRSEFNNIEQARSRVAFYGLSGLPLTLGDEISSLDDGRIELLKRIMPTVSLHTGELEIKKRDERFQIVNAAFARSGRAWNVAGVTNFLAEQAEIAVDTAADLRLDSSMRYALFDFWDQKFIGTCSSKFTLDIKPYDTKVVRVTPLDGSVVTLIGSNRHISQGAVEIESEEKDGSSINYNVKCVENEPLILTMLLDECVQDIKSSGATLERDGNICKIAVSGNGSSAFSLEYSLK